MGLYELPKFERPRIKFSDVKVPKFLKNRVLWLAVSVVFVSSLFGFIAGLVSGSYFYLEIKDYLSGLNIDIPTIEKIIEKEYIPQTSQEELIIRAVEKASPAVVSIVVTKDVPVFEQYFYSPFGDPFFSIPQYRQKGTEKQEIGGGTGFIVSKEGLVLTNKHVVLDTEAEYTIFTNDGNRYAAKVLARDPLQDLAVLKIEQEKTLDGEGAFSLKSFPTVQLGDSDSIRIAQTAIAIGNALGEFRNTVSVGTVSGLGRTITASGGGLVETIEDVIQTDAAINLGNSGGPLLNLQGKVIGINTAMVQDAQNIGFAIPINKAKRDIEQVSKIGKIVYPYLGIRYVLLNDYIKEANNLSVNYGAWLTKGSAGEAAVTPGSAAETAGLRENDIILEFNGQIITTGNSLSKLIQKYNPGDKIVLKVLRDNEELFLQIILDERTE